jgi:shikimate kinase
VNPVDRIVLVGMMGAGKSTVGRALAATLGWPLLDNDALIRAATGRDGPSLFREEGEDALHRAERAALLEAIGRSGPAVITAAGSVVDESALRAGLVPAHVVWLRAAPATLQRRIGAGSGRRGDAVDAAWLRALAERREPLYREIADHVVDVDDRSVGQVVEEIVGEIRRRADPGSAD